MKCSDSSRREAIIITALILGGVPRIVLAQERRPVSIAVTGESNLRLNFVDQLRSAAKDAGIVFELATRDDNPTYTLIIAQETTLGTAAAAVIALDKSGEVSFSVVRSGRLSGKGALNACAKETAKKLAVLTR